MTALKKLEDMLFHDPTKELLNISVTWGPDAHLMTVEERAQALLNALNAAETKTTEIDDI